MNTMVISDTHGNTNSIISLLMRNESITRIIHLGDMVRDAEDLEAAFPEREVIMVRGNNDFFTRVRDEAVTVIGGRKVFMTHGHLYGVRSGTGLLVKRAKELGADTVLFGHTHTKCDKTVDGITVLNPSASQYILFDYKGNYRFCEL